VRVEYEWAQIQRDLQAVQEMAIEENGTTLAVRSQCVGISSEAPRPYSRGFFGFGVSLWSETPLDPE